MEFREVVRKRRMVRRFTSEPVAPDVIDRMLQLAHHAPSAGFTQGQSFIAVTQPELKQTIARLCSEEEYTASGFHPFISEAPALIIPCVSEAAYHRRYQEPDKINEQGQEIIWPVPFWYMDIGCSVMILLLAAVDEGLGAGFAGITTNEHMAELRDLLHIPAEIMPMGVIPIGHRADDTRSRSLKRGRKPAHAYIHHEGW